MGPAGSCRAGGVGRRCSMDNQPHCVRAGNRQRGGRHPVDRAAVVDPSSAVAVAAVRLVVDGAAGNEDVRSAGRGLGDVVLDRRVGRLAWFERQNTVCHTDRGGGDGGFIRRLSGSRSHPGCR